MIIRTASGLLAAFLACAAPANAQVAPDEAVKKILETIDEELSEIDRLLMQSRDAQSASGAEASKQFREALEETEGSQKRVVRGIDSLIEQLQQMQQQQQQGGGGGQPQQQERSGDPLEDQQQSQRQDSGQQQQDTSQLRPDGQQQQEQQQNQDGQAQNNQDDPTSGRNRQDGERSEDGEERVIREADRARWGALQSYDLHLHIRGGLPKVPEKYRRFLEAYQKTNQRTRKTGNGR